MPQEDGDAKKGAEEKKEQRSLTPLPLGEKEEKKKRGGADCNFPCWSRQRRGEMRGSKKRGKKETGS